MYEKLPLTDTSLISAVMPSAKVKAKIFEKPLQQAMIAFDILGVLREAAFLAQIAHESGELHHVREIWGPTDWQVKYEGHKGLGNILPGDGKRFMGRGLIQLTGRDNYRRCSLALFQDDRLLNNPTLLEEPENAALSAAWYWNERRINVPADAGDFQTVTKRINPALLGFQKRQAYYQLALECLKAASLEAIHSGE
ncbi:putative chitinase [Gammaproteobacteria bacterium]